MESEDKVPIPDKRQTAIMLGHFKKATAEPNEHVKFAMSEDNACVWYIRLYNMEGRDSEFIGGEYDCRMIAPADFPFSPPRFYFLTKNGLYEVETKVCISIGEFHADQYRATLGMAGFANQLVSGLIGWREMGGGISILTSSAQQKAAFAKQSREHNMKHHPAICNLIEGSFAGYSAKWDKSKIPAETLKRIGLTDVPADAAAPTAVDTPAADKPK